MVDTIDRQTSTSFLIVGIGTSAGGLRALEDFFGNMPSDSNAAFIVVQHLSPDYKSLMSELLKRHTDMDVQQVTDQVSLCPNTVFLIPPGQNMVLKDGCLHLTPQERGRGRQPNLPIDLFFKSLSLESREKTISVILSGTGSDGSQGIQEISEKGGIVLVQAPETAEFDGMPQSAISTGVVDLILPASELAQTTYQLVTAPNGLQVLRDNLQNQLIPIKLQKIINIIEQHDDIDFGHYKPSSITRRIRRRCLIAGYQDLDSYISRLNASKEERNCLRNDLLITVTRFFRDVEAWQFLENNVLPELLDRFSSGQTLRIWITACATGEEAYSMAILVRELLDQRQLSIEVKIFATDLDQVALNKASLGIYPAPIVNEIGEARVSRFFTSRNDGSFEVSRAIREMIIFANHNLAKDAGFTQVDLVTCRNVLIYMQTDLQAQVLRNLHFALNVNGILFLGESETLGILEEEFDTLHRKWKIYQKLRDVKLSLSTGAFAALKINRPQLQVALSDKNSRFDPLLEQAFKTLLNQREATCLLVDRQMQLLYVCGDTLSLLRVPDGRQSNDLIEMLPQSLQLPLSTALHRICQGRDSRVCYNSYQIKEPEYECLTVNVEVSRQAANRKTGEFFLIVISQESGPDTALPSNQFETSDDTAQYVLQLERDLQHTRENLQATIEELETTNEEQQATNEELIASNEELQSTNEELQSVNEELYTVNAEYQSKIQSLTELNNDLDNLLGNIEVGVIFLDNGLRIRKYTSAATVAYNLVANDVGRPIGHLSHNLENLDLLVVLEQFKEQRKTIEQEVQVKHQGPHLLMRIHPYLAENQTVDGVILTFVNIDEIKRTQLRLEAAEARLSQSNEILEQKIQGRTAELTASQERYDLAVKGARVGLWDRNLLTNENYISPQYREILGYEDDQDELQNWHTAFESKLHPGDYGRVMEALNNHLQHRVPYQAEYRMRKKNGDYCWVYARGQAIWDESGNPVRITGSVIDISDRKAAEKELQDSEARYRNLYESTPAILCSINNEDELVSISHHWLQTFGYDHTEVIGRKFTEFLTPESRQYAVDVVMPDFLENGVCHNIPYQWICKDGSIRDVLLSATVEQGTSGILPRSLAVLSDVTEHNKSQAELVRYQEHLEELVEGRTTEIKQANQQLQAEVLERQRAQSELANRAQALEQSNADLEQFAYVVSHDLQEPLRAMTVFAQLLEGDYGKHLDATAHDYIGHIVEGGIRMHGLINGILAFSRATHREITFTAVELEQVLTAAIKNLSSAIEESQAVITHDVLPSLNVDEPQILQLFQNLISNAIKFRGAEPPRIHMGAEWKNNQWTFSLQDNGIGIPKEQQERTFGLFQRLHTREEKEGYGIGLAVCKKVVERHQGHIWLESEPGQGSAFYFTLGMPKG
ncbi:chemotaxis protein CheB [Adonisia turfae]|uniref:histidine kinase n=1 Tax=Adonisia turfae CCMR0081 TaxID=2292702 RepID=A0A6M0RN01_9CYAN|nr:chemotaxis protein CheB [Adonisia turfae]NEZ57123.1 PAS domain S-box protein [Adonisia turfae CCMR0081]